MLCGPTTANQLSQTRVQVKQKRTSTQTCTQLFKKPKCASGAEWVKKPWWMHTMKHNSTIRNRLLVITTWIQANRLKWAGKKKKLFLKNSIYAKFYQMYSNLVWTESHLAAPRGCEWRQLDYKGRTSQPLRVVVMEMFVISAVGMVSWVCAHIKTHHTVSVRVQFPVSELCLYGRGGCEGRGLPPPHPPCSLQK